ncbi:hypothetical protein P3F01_15695 [Clostridium perfringens]|uniref:hypothetical protein n=1 Tax=Clostridium perfringens TaxID=1502 RepID=UPI0028E15094|nr:hypothetical protein [Clostridium perfringens]MDT9337803.1 hypothetical protein [Clostridium perfringens]MDT9345560.1 hypothetical protein [Clostridium perfringens]MDT9348803.1 hypothetical protein [Clostridium perfringens]MDT9354595.1 hypothetical protein [Clostridium perfringens]
MDKNIKLSREELHVINRNIKSVQMKFRAISVFEFIKCEIIKNNGILKMTIKDINDLYKDKYYKFSYSVMRRIIDELIKLNLIKVIIHENKRTFCLGKYN